MPENDKFVMTLEDLRGHLAQAKNINDGQRTDRRSKIKRFADVVGKHPSEIVAEPTVIRALASKANWHMAGLSKNGWANILSAVTRAMMIAGIAVHRRRRNFRLSLSWETLMETLGRRDRDELHRFAGWCSIHQVAPDAVDKHVFQRFLDYLTRESILFNPKERWHVARRAWNRMATSGHGSSYPVIDDVEPTGWRGLKWTDFPQSLQREIAAYRHKLLVGDMFSDVDMAPLKAVTVDGYIDKLRWYLSRLVEAGIPVDRFSSLSVCVEPELVKAGLKAHLGDRSLDDTTRPGLHAMMTAVLSVAHYVNAASEQIDTLKKFARTVRHRPNGMTTRNRERLSQFSDRKAKRTLASLPYEIAHEMSHIATPTVREAQRMQLAVLLALLTHIPLRIKNAAMIDLDKHVQRPVVKSKGRWRIHFAMSEVKNKQTIDAELNEETSALFELYVSRFRPVLLKHPTGHLFIGQNGQPKTPSKLSKQFKEFVKRETGFEMNAHLMRHLAAFTLLDALPGQYETARQLLGHKNISTTVSFYAGAETRSAFSQYDRVLAKIAKNDDTGTEAEDKP